MRNTRDTHGKHEKHMKNIWGNMCKAWETQDTREKHMGNTIMRNTGNT